MLLLMILKILEEEAGAVMAPHRLSFGLQHFQCRVKHSRHDFVKEHFMCHLIQFVLIDYFDI